MWQCSFHIKVMVACGMIRVVQWVGASVSEELVASIFRVEETLSTLSTEAAGCFKKLVPVYQTTQRKKIQVIWIVMLCLSWDE